MGKPLLHYLALLFGRRDRSQTAASSDGTDPAKSAGAPAAAQAAEPVLTPPLPAEPPSDVERIFAQRERLFLFAAQLLDEPQAALQVVTETLKKAMVMPKELPADAELLPALERVLVSLTLVRLKATAMPKGPPAFSQSARAARDSAKDSDGVRMPRVPELSSDAADPADDEEELDAELDSEHERLERTAQVLRGLPVEARVMVTLTGMLGRTLSEAAELMSVSPLTCRYFLTHGRKLLRRALQKDLFSAEGEGLAAGMLGPDARGGGEATLHDLRRSKKAIARA